MDNKKPNTSISASMHHLMMASMYYEDYMRDAHTNSLGYRLFKTYNDRVKWILKDLATHPFFPEDVRNGIKSELNSDVLAIPEIAHRLHLLSPKDRQFIEDLIDSMSSDNPTEIVGSIRIPEISGNRLTELATGVLSLELIGTTEDANVIQRLSKVVVSTILIELVEILGENQFTEAFVKALTEIKE